MSEASPCLNCGACCSHFRVSFFWGECASSGGTVPDELVEQISPSRVAMIGTGCKPVRCTSLVGEVGSTVLDLRKTLQHLPGVRCFMGRWPGQSRLRRGPCRIRLAGPATGVRDVSEANR